VRPDLPDPLSELFEGRLERFDSTTLICSALEQGRELLAKTIGHPSVTVTPA
jgi:hypothetical protein